MEGSGDLGVVFVVILVYIIDLYDGLYGAWGDGCRYYDMCYDYTATY